MEPVRQPVGLVRALRNEGTDDFRRPQVELIDKLDKGAISRTDAQEKVEEFWVGRLRNAVVDGDVSHGSLMTGQSVGLVHGEMSVQEIMDDLVGEKEEPLNTSTKRALFWTPRILCILFAMFLSLFAMDVFGEGYGFWKTSGALLIHLLPVYIVIIALVIAWRWEWIGAILFIALALFYVVWTWGRHHWGAYVGMSGPLFLLGVLFLLNWICRAELRSR